MKKIRILHFELDDKPGGIESFILNLYTGIEKSKFDFDIISRKSNPAKAKELEALGARVIKIHSYKNIFSYLKDLKKVLMNNYDIIHLNKNSAAVIFPFFMSSVCSNSKVIVHSHNTSPNGNKLLTLLHYLNRRYIYRISDIHLACSNAAGKWMFGNNGFTIFNNAIDLEKYKYNEKLRNELRKELGLEGKKVIGHIGRFCYQKNHDFLIDIFNELLKAEKDAILLLIGEGELEQEIKDKVKNLGIENKVFFMGRRTDAYRYYQSMDLFLLPSRYEGLPVVGVEAQACGLPCVFSDCVTEEAKILDTTVFVSGGKEKYVKEIINSLQVERKDTSEEMRKAGYDIAIEVRELEKIYCSLIEDK